MNPSPDKDRVSADPWLREALRHAPGGDVPVPAAVRSAILDQARRAATPVQVRRQPSWREALMKVLTPTGMGWAGAVTAGVLVLLVTGLQRQSVPPEPAVAQLPPNGPVQVLAQKPSTAVEAVAVMASQAGGGTERANPPAAEVAGTTLALAEPQQPQSAVADPVAKAVAKAAAPADASDLAASRAGARDAGARAPAMAVAADTTRPPDSTNSRVAMAMPAPAAVVRAEAPPAGVSASVAVEASPPVPQVSVAAAPAPASVATAAPVLAQAPAAPPAAAAEAASAGTLRRADPSAIARTRGAPEASAEASSQARMASALANTAPGRPAAAALVPARTVTEDRLGEVLQWTLGREGLRWIADGREGPWGPAQEAWLRALRAAASGRWGEAPPLPAPTVTVVLQAPGQPAVRLSVGDTPWAVWVQVEGAAPFVTRLDSRARVRIESLRQGW